MTIGNSLKFFRWCVIKLFSYTFDQVIVHTMDQAYENAQCILLPDDDILLYRMVWRHSFLIHAPARPSPPEGDASAGAVGDILFLPTVEIM